MKTSLPSSFKFLLIITTALIFSCKINAQNCIAPPNAGTTVSSATIVCPSSPFTLSLSGATTGTGQTYQWQSSVTGAQGSWTNLQGETGNTAFVFQQVATWYRAVVTCNGQSDTSLPVQVQVHPSPTVNLGADTSVCSGDTPFIINAGAGFVSYQWNTNDTTQTIGISTAGNYIVTVIDTNGCTGTGSKSISIGFSPFLSIGNDTFFCENTSVNVKKVITSPHLPAMMCYMNDTKIPCNSPVSTVGIYKVILTSVFGCSTIDSINIFMLPAPVVDLGADTAICHGDSIVFDLPHNWPHPYSPCRWEDNSTDCKRIVKNAGIYVLTVTGMNGCSTKDTIEVTVNPLPDPDFTYVQTDIDRVEFDAVEANAALYLWDFGNGQTGTGRSTYTIYSKPGHYKVSLNVIDQNGCIDSLWQIVNLTSSTRKSKASDNSIKSYPNPFTEHTTIFFTAEKSGKMLLEVFDMIGKKVTTLADGHFTAGEHVVSFIPHDFGYNSGQFLIRLVQDEKVSVKQVVQVK